MTDNFIAGFHDKLQQDETPAGAAVAGSQNFALDDDGKWFTRPGSAYFGTISALTTPTTSCGKLVRRDGVELPIVNYGTTIQIYHNGKKDWMTLLTGLTNNTVWGFGESDLSTDNVNSIAFGNGRDNFQYWNGATAMFLSATVNTVTIQGTTTLANLGFTATGSIVIQGDVYTYTGIAGAGGLQFTGVAPDPSLSGYINISGIAQLPVAYAGNPKGSVFCPAQNGRIIIGDVRPSGSIYGGGQIYGSKNANAVDYTQSTPRLANDGFVINLGESGDTIQGLAQFEGGIIVFKRFTASKLSFSQDGNDIPAIIPLLPYDPHNSGDIGSVSSLSVFRLGQSVCFISPTNVINTIQRVQAAQYPEPVAISDPIKKTTDSYVFDTTSAGVSWRGRAFFACKSSGTPPKNDRILVYNERYGAWETPVVGLGISSFFTYNALLYGALNDSPNVAQLWTGTADLTSGTTNYPINSVLKLFKHTFGMPSTRKTFSKMYLEWEMLQTGSFTLSLQYNENGTTRSVTIQGTDTGLQFASSPLGAFGTEPFGTDTFGPAGDAAAASTSPVRYRVILTTTEYPFYYVQPSFTTSSYFKLIRYGFNAGVAQMVQPASIKRKLA